MPNLFFNKDAYLIVNLIARVADDRNAEDN